MAVNAIEPMVAQHTPSDTDRMLMIWQAAQAVIRSAADAGQFDIAMGLMSRFDESYSGMDIGPLFAAMKLAGREKDLPPAMAEVRSFDMYTGPALVAAGRDADFAGFVKSRKLSGYDLAGMRMAGELMAGHADKALAILAPFTGADRANAVTRTLEMLLLARRMDASGPMFAHLDLATPDGVAACARIAEGTKARATAERCADALDGLPPKAKADYFGAGTVVPEVVGGLAAAGDWDQALSSRSRSTEGQSEGGNRQARQICPFAGAASDRPESVFVRLGGAWRLSGQDAGSCWPACGGGGLRRDGAGRQGPGQMDRRRGRGAG